MHSTLVYNLIFEMSLLCVFMTYYIWYKCLHIYELFTLAKRVTIESNKTIKILSAHGHLPTSLDWDQKAPFRLRKSELLTNFLADFTTWEKFLGD